MSVLMRIRPGDVDVIIVVGKTGSYLEGQLRPRVPEIIIGCYTGVREGRTLFELVRRGDVIVVTAANVEGQFEWEGPKNTRPHVTGVAGIDSSRRVRGKTRRRSCLGLAASPRQKNDRRQ